MRAIIQQHGLWMHQYTMYNVESCNNTHLHKLDINDFAGSEVHHGVGAKLGRMARGITPSVSLQEACLCPSPWSPPGVPAASSPTPGWWLVEGRSTGAPWMSKYKTPFRFMCWNTFSTFVWLAPSKQNGCRNEDITCKEVSNRWLGIPAECVITLVTRWYYLQLASEGWWLNSCDRSRASGTSYTLWIARAAAPRKLCTWAGWGCQQAFSYEKQTKHSIFIMVLWPVTSDHLCHPNFHHTIFTDKLSNWAKLDYNGLNGYTGRIKIFIT